MVYLAFFVTCLVVSKEYYSMGCVCRVHVPPSHYVVPKNKSTMRLHTHTNRYDLHNIEIAPHKDFRTQSGVQYAMEGFYYIKVMVDEVLYEGGRSIR